MDRLAQCHCGSLRAKTSGDPLTVSLCHCRDCQRRTGAVASSGAIFAKSEVTLRETGRSSSATPPKGARSGSASARIAGRRCIGKVISARSSAASRSAPSRTRPFRRPCFPSTNNPGM
ncbi:hypothetical protein RCCGEPOP_36203, partial [Rhizobium sp. Pop5]